MIERIPYIAKPYAHIMTNRMLDVPRGAIWANMGMGKTVATLTALDLLFLAGDDKPALVIAPLRVAKNTWPSEARKWDHLRQVSVMPICGSEAERLQAMRYDYPIYSINYDNIPWLVDHWGDRWPYDKIVSDEATRLKGFRLRQGSVRAAALGRVSHKYVKRFIELTGTPSPNGLSDLWGQLWHIDAGKRLGRTYEGFKNRWFQKSFDGYGVLPLPYAPMQIPDAIRDVCLTIDAKDWFDVKDPIFVPVYVDLPPKARLIYNDMEKKMFAQIEEHGVEVFNAAARTNKCLQIANGAAYLNPEITDDGQPQAKKYRVVHDEKITALESIIEEANGMPVLVAYEFRSDLDRMRRAFPSARLLDSSQQTEDDWNAGHIPILLCHPKSAGHGLNLQFGSNILVLFGHNWNLEEYLQVIERIGPIRQMQAGFNRPVFVYLIIARDTVDELVIARRASKRTVQDVLLEACKHRRANHAANA